MVLVPAGRAAAALEPAAVAPAVGGSGALFKTPTRPPKSQGAKYKLQAFCTFDRVLRGQGHHHHQIFLRSAAFHSVACVFPSQKCTLDQDVEDPLIDFFLQELQKNK